MEVTGHTIASRKMAAAGAPQAQPKIQGHLFKQGHSLISKYTSWKKRLFVLRPQAASLEYYDEATLKGSVRLGRGSRVLDAPSPEHGFVVVAPDGTRYPLQAASSDDKAKWMRAIGAVVAGERDFDKLHAAWETQRHGHVALPIDAGGGVPRARTERKLRREEKKKEKARKREEVLWTRKKTVLISAIAGIFVLWLVGVLPWRPSSPPPEAGDLAPE